LSLSEYLSSPPARTPNASSALPPESLTLLSRSILATFLIHYNSRVASLCGHGFYTIGPCGEEAMAGAALPLGPGGSVALHYRHLATNLARFGAGNDDEAWRSVLLGRARAHAVSSLDPVTRGGHCALGGCEGDVLVTSTLASQCPPAVGRALGGALARWKAPQAAKFGAGAVHFVTLGSGSLSNGHFLSAVNLARHAAKEGRRVPVVFGVSDNGLCISLKDTSSYLRDLALNSGVKVFEARGNDVEDVYERTREAVEYARKRNRPAVVWYGGITRRFGHAATDRQGAYLEQAEIEEMRASRDLEDNLKRLVDAGLTWDEVRADFEFLKTECEAAFDVASTEPKVESREEQVSRCAVPYAEPPRHLPPGTAPTPPFAPPPSGKREVMRKQMTRCISEAMSSDPRVVYIGEDVEHGGYYLVTSGLKDLHPGRVVDFPPDETTLVGAGMGFAQAGLVPIVEIPYAKYLDCGFDMFTEAACMTWLSGGREGMGMVVRLQGFDRGTFGGNFHTHNTLYCPPGVDVVCYSNGEDYARGMRSAVDRAKQGRMSMLVDCTDLLNKRHVLGKDKAWLRPYPASRETLSLHDVRTYGDGEGGGRGGRGKVAVVTYGNGVVTSLQAREALPNPSDVDVVDCMLLSSVPDGLKEELAHYDRVVFADICKEGMNPLSGMLGELQRPIERGGAGLAGKRWCAKAAARGYNPLGSLVTFLNVDDVLEGIDEVLQ